MPVDEQKQKLYESLVRRGYFEKNPDKKALADSLIRRGSLRAVGGKSQAQAPRPKIGKLTDDKLGGLLDRYNAGNQKSASVGDLRAYEGAQSVKEKDQAPIRAQQLLAGARGLGASVIDALGKPNFMLSTAMGRAVDPSQTDEEVLRQTRDRESWLNRIAGPGGQSYRQGAISALPAVAALDPAARAGAAVGEKVGGRFGPAGGAIGGIVGGVGASLIPGVGDAVTGGVNWLNRMALGAPAADFLSGETASAQQSNPQGFEVGSLFPMGLYQKPSLGLDAQSMIGRGIGAGIGAGTALATGHGDPLIQGLGGAVFSGRDTALGAANSRMAHGAVEGAANKLSMISTPRTKTTIYGYKGDQQGDSYTRAGKGAWGNSLREGSIALSRDLEAQLKAQGVKPMSRIAVRVKGKDGQEQIIDGFWDDRTAESYNGKKLRGRVDLYRPDGSNTHDDLQVLGIITEGNPQINPRQTNINFNRMMMRDPATAAQSGYDDFSTEPLGLPAYQKPPRTWYAEEGGLTQVPESYGDPYARISEQELPSGVLARFNPEQPPRPVFNDPSPYYMHPEQQTRGPEVLGQVPLDNPEGYVPTSFSRPLLKTGAPRPAFTNTLGDAAAEKIPASSAHRFSQKPFSDWVYEDVPATEQSPVRDITAPVVEQAAAPSGRALKNVRRKPTTTKSRRPAPKPAFDAAEADPNMPPVPVEPVAKAPAPAPTVQEPPKPVAEAPVAAKTVAEPAQTPHKAGDTVLVKPRSNSLTAIEGRVVHAGTMLNGKPLYSVELPPNKNGMPRTLTVAEGDPRLIGKAPEKPPAQSVAEPPKPVVEAPAAKPPIKPVPEEVLSAAIRDVIKWSKEPVISGASPEQKAAILSNRLRTGHGAIPPEHRAAILEEFLSGPDVPRPNPTEGASAPVQSQAKRVPKAGDVVSVNVGKNLKGEPVLKEAVVVRRKKDGGYIVNISTGGIKSDTILVHEASAEDISFKSRPESAKPGRPSVKKSITHEGTSISVDGDNITASRGGEDVALTSRAKTTIKKLALDGAPDEAVAAVANSASANHEAGTLVRVPAAGSTPDNIIWTYAVRGKSPRGGGRTRPIPLEQPEWVKNIWEAQGNKSDLPAPAGVIHNTEMVSFGDASPASVKNAKSEWATRNAPKAEPAPKTTETPEAKASFRKGTAVKRVVMPGNESVDIHVGAEVKARFFRFPRAGKGPTFEGGAGVDHVEVPLRVKSMPVDTGNIHLVVSEDTVVRPNHARKGSDIVIPEGTEFVLRVPKRKTANPNSPFEPINASKLARNEITLEDLTSVQVGENEFKIYKGKSKLMLDGGMLESRTRKEAPHDSIVESKLNKLTELRKKGCP